MICKIWWLGEGWNLHQKLLHCKGGIHKVHCNGAGSNCFLHVPANFICYLFNCTPCPLSKYRPCCHSSNGTLMRMVQLPHFILQLLYLPQAQFVIQVVMYIFFFNDFVQVSCFARQSHWLCSLRQRTVAAHLPGWQVQSPPCTTMYVLCKCCVFSSRGLCNELITHPEENYWIWCVWV